MLSTKNHPNILWISLEDTSPRLGCYGDPLARTPHIDSLAGEGILYRNAFATAGVCSPSRSSIITGMYPTYIGAHHMRTSHTNPFAPELPTPYEAVPPPQVKAFTEYLRAKGYYCSNNTKTDYQFAPPLTAWDENGREAHWRNREPGQPFFAVFNYDFTHETCMFGDSFWSRYPGSSLQKENKPLITDPDQIEVPPYIPDTSKSREALARYYDRIGDADEFVGKLLGQLEEDGLSDNTIVFLWSDHGEGLPRAKRWTYDAGIHVPLIVRWPQVIPGGQVNAELVSLLDLGPTVLELAGVEVPCHMQGRPFLCRGPEARRTREYVFAARDRYDEAYDRVRAVRDKRFKYIRNYEPLQPYLQWTKFSHHHPMFQELWRLRLRGELATEQLLFLQNARPVAELYDCAEDPYEMRNLAGLPEYAEEEERLSAALDEWQAKYDPWGEVPEERMVRLMWPGGVQPQTAPVLYVAINGTNPGVEPSPGGFYDEPTAVMLYCATQGASIAYTMERGGGAIEPADNTERRDRPRWQLYAGPLVLDRPGHTVIRAKAVRIGYKDSEETVASYELVVQRAEGEERGG
ncbi:Choline-sulfatase [compost metagenome]